MSRSRPASNPISYHKHTKQFYVTRTGRRIYLGSDKDEALKQYRRLGLGLELNLQESTPLADITAKELANRFITAQRANWRSPQTTLRSYKGWLERFLKDHPRLKIADFTVEKFAEWKLSLQRRKYSAESINHFLSAVRAMFNFAEDTEVINKAPKLKRVRNEPRSKPGSKEKPIYSSADISKLTEKADFQMKIMIMLALNCGFGPKDLHDLTWDDIDGNRVTLPRCKTGVCQTYLLWPELQQLLECIRQKRKILEKRTSLKTLIFKNHNHVFLTKFGHPWNKDALSEQFRKLCNKAGVPCYGFYRLRHCASTAMSLVASPHVHRKFMRHSQLQQQVTYTHTPDVEVNKAVMKAREKLFGKHCLISNEERSQELEKVV